MPKINYERGTLKEFSKIPQKRNDTIYIIEDAGKIFKGNFDITKGFQVALDYDNLTVDNTLPGNFYFDPIYYRLKVRFVSNGVDQIEELFPGFVTAGSSTQSAGDALTTASFVKKAIDDAIKEVNRKIEIVKLDNVTEDNKVVVTNGDRFGDSGYSIGDGEISGSASDKVLATEKGAKKVAEDEASKAVSTWSAFG